jgi:hypothetical protein
MNAEDAEGGGKERGERLGRKAGEERQGLTQSTRGPEKGRRRKRGRKGRDGEGRGRKGGEERQGKKDRVSRRAPEDQRKAGEGIGGKREKEWEERRRREQE